ncbi:MAG: lamin tail domain-containing protein, partial [Planctomycetota bacterium]
MRKSISLYPLISVLILCLSGSVGATCLDGDLSGNCRVDFEDVLSLAAQWLGPAGSDADIVGSDGVNLGDFAAQAKNWGKNRSKVIINEIHYDPDVKTELVEYIELYNRSGFDVDISGWYFDRGISYTFGNSVVLRAGEYAVVAQVPDQVQGKFGVSSDILYGPWVGKLSNDGESVVLRDADGDKVDEVDYKIGFPWPTVGGPPGYSIEFVNPAFDNDLGGNWRPSEPDFVVPPSTLIEEGARWKYFEGTEEASEPNTRAWREIDFDDSSWKEGNLIIGYGENFIDTPLDMRNNYSSVYLRIEFDVDDPSAIGGLELDAIYDDGFNAYINNKHVRNVNMQSDEMPYSGTARGAREDHNWNTFTLPTPSGYLVQGTNVLAIHLHNASLGNSSDCFLDVRLEATASAAGPSPGRRNTSFADNLPPKMRQVKHRPKEPKSGEDVTITAKITDSDGVEYVMLFYQAVDPGSYIELNDSAYETGWNMIAMNDDGIGGDIEAGDDVYTVVLDGSKQVHRRLMRYRISAWDYTGLETKAPYRYSYENEPVPNFAYFVYDGVPNWSGAARPGVTPVVHYSSEVLTKVPVYHLISKLSSVEHCQWIDKYGGDSYKWYGTLVYDGKVYDHIRYRTRGGVWRYAMGKNMWKFDFNRGQSFQARDDYGKKYDTKWDKLNFSACIQQGNYLHRGEQGMFEAAGFKMFNLMGSPASKTNWLHFRVIDDAVESGPSQYDGDFWGLYMTIEQMDGRFLDEHLLPDGNLYKIEGHNAESNNQGPYSVTDRSDFEEFKRRRNDGYGYYEDPDPTEQWWRDNVDVNGYYGYRCVVEGIHHGDIGYGKNWFFYLNPQTDIWSMLAWDLDLTWANNMYGNGEDVFKSRGAIFSHSALLLEYRNRLREFYDLLYNSEQMNQMLDELAGFIDDPSGGPSIVDADRAMWDYNPIMTSGYVNSNKAGAGRFYQKAATKDFPGMVQIMKDYVNGYKEFDTYSEDSSAPYTPTIYYEGPAGYPVNALQFRTSVFSDPQGFGTFAAMKWRIAEVTDQSAPCYDHDDPLELEIETVWESEEMTTFRPDMRIPGSEVKEGHAYRVRCKMKDTSGRWSHWSSPIQFIVGEAISEGILGSLRITEMMYNPADADTSRGELNVDNDEFEFIELKNVGDESVDLTYASFVQWITFYFYGSDVTSVEPGEFVLVVRNKLAFESRYPGLTDIIAGQYIDTDTKLSNGGETVQLIDMWNGTIAQFEYSDGRGWPLPADGSGHSLVPLASAIPDTPLGTLNYGGNWRHSAYIGGSPGADDPELARSVVVNEVMAHTDYSNPANPEHDSDDWIELFNTTGATIGLSGWYLSDDKDEPNKWAIPAVNISGNGRISFNEVDHFHNPLSIGFGLDKAGEEVLLSYLPGNSMDRVVDYVRFKGEENHIS